MGTLLIVIISLFSIDLIGEVMIFTYSRDVKESEVKDMLE